MSDLGSQEAVEAVYTERNEAVALLVALARRLGYPTYSYTMDDPEWPVVFIELPRIGQVSWHIPMHEMALFFPPMQRKTSNPWDGHDNREKAARLRKAAQWMA